MTKVKIATDRAEIVAEVPNALANEPGHANSVHTSLTHELDTINVKEESVEKLG